MENRLLGNVKVNVTNRNEILSKITTRLNEKQKTVILFLNAHCYNIAQKDDIYRKHINASDFVLNDGIGVELGAKLFNFRFDENLNGTDFTPQLLEAAAISGDSIFLLGGQPGVAETAKTKLERRIPGLKIVGCSDGYFTHSQKIVEQINQSKADIVIVGMGVPLQEKWIYNHKDLIHSTLFVGVGAYIDFASERIKRAPSLLRKMRMEWLYRLLHEPKRLWKRNIGSLIFFYYIFKNKSRKKRG
ncbi:N-acetylglucosaminyldiphosphoundecaprenol N-acetyl-beta-D-mannosaminyltransferase [Pullulanibacillus pueri]|uniref:UDP-N-acetyl-D-mannosaminuronic acid transferase n=1 Tax=Pullulanibacillus pueri TaxID=1437324 RepID=A0A8J3A2M8_9BACL|nr:WecB/TagA/CpsF family glycosyltransferase [Pullulanibacillus pueri]MBM7684109.1 N-acetylglucosaminyldiphosphoundecaprenol N-acetyl-beta-D-mannosaminyltransferase [Pullulanibacillus pueri]GGH88678.1 UDP-N-acetyl-D-mannosaminuronic acid transferase [Pullulanibacillus pueri]